jgi:hypothetical protein
MPTTKTLLEFIDRFPPFLVYALARKDLKAISREQIAAVSGIPFRTVIRISNRLSWAEMKIEDIDAFARGCNFNFFHIRLQSELIRRSVKGKRRSFHHLSTKRWNRFLLKCQEYEAAKQPTTP